MPIVELRILPPVAIGRLGSSPTPLEAFDLEVSDKHPLDYRRIVPRQSFRIDPGTGEPTAYTPDRIRFKEPTGRIRPVAPFLEVFATTAARPDQLIPLTTTLLSAEGLNVAAVRWSVEAGNIKVFRRTGDAKDKILARADVSDHAPHPLRGECPNFLPGKTLPLGSVQFVRPTAAFPEIRFRFTPAAGKVYGSSKTRHTSPTAEVPDPVITSDDLILYDITKGTWRGYAESGGPTLTNPGQIFAGYDTDTAHVSWGYLDDECDGVVTVTLTLAGGKQLTARAHFGAGPPAFAPDTLPVRVVSDEIEQLLLGPDVTGDVPPSAAEDVVRRAVETVRLMNTAVMNGNSIDGRQNIASTMARQDTGDFGRLFEPIMATSLVDNLALLALHERVFNGLGAGGAAWFAGVLRRPDEIGDLGSSARRKMPALMRNADGRALTLTHRQINTVAAAGAEAIFRAPEGLRAVAGATSADALQPANRTAQVHYRGAGNPFSVLPRSAISNCFPGLEFDFRNLWRRALVGIVLIENNNFVLAAEDPAYQNLVGRRLLQVDGSPTMVVTQGPVFPGGDSQRLGTTANPNAISFMEWSNSLARVLQKPGQQVDCVFTRDPSDTEVLAGEVTDTVTVKLTVRAFFDGASAAFAPGLLQPGELTQGLCAPWQNDYRECACYYWAASRPDYVNVEPDANGVSHGDMWLSKRRTGEYVPDNRVDTRLVSYDDLFKDWERELRFIIRGQDAEESR